MAHRPAISSIAMALAGKTPSMDIPSPHDERHPAGKDGVHAVHDQPDSRRGPLPTPPSSLSPSFHPHGFKHRAANMPDSPVSAPVQVDSDIDLHDPASRHHHHHHSDNQHLQPGHGGRDGHQQQLRPLPLVAGTLDNLAGLESAGAISPALLAKYHLPDILLTNGPLAIRHIMGCLTTNVPGFSGIPPAKARRLVVAALEGKGGSSGGEAGGVHGDVHFEKVGWGRWDAKRRGKNGAIPKESVPPAIHNATPPSSVPSSYPRQLQPSSHDAAHYGSSMTAESVVLSHSEFACGDQDHADASMLEHEADKMSLDGDERVCCSSSEASDNDALMDGDWDEADVTDEEDWAQIGAAALRARSFPNTAENMPNNIHDRSKWRNHGSGGGPSYATLTKSAPLQPPQVQHPALSSFPDGVAGNIEERAAVEALLKLGSM